LAVISLAHHPDPERFVTELSGSERTVAGYLRTEVLERQPAEVRELLRAGGRHRRGVRHAQAARDWPLASRLLAANHLAR
jgi:ATP/maltotriose-dependent transcriptional regulator MalT